MNAEIEILGLPGPYEAAAVVAAVAAVMDMQDAALAEAPMLSGQGSWTTLGVGDVRTWGEGTWSGLAPLADDEVDF